MESLRCTIMRGGTSKAIFLREEEKRAADDPGFDRILRALTLAVGGLAAISLAVAGILVGLLNTIKVSVLGIILATLLGTLSLPYALSLIG